MSEITYQVILSTDGKHTVIATCDDVTRSKAALEWARSTYEQIVATYGLKGEQSRKNGTTVEPEDVPACAIHNVPMVKVQGKFGQFWSCHQQNQDGSFCSYRPNGH